MTAKNQESLDHVPETSETTATSETSLYIRIQHRPAYNETTLNSPLNNVPHKEMKSAN